VCLSALRGVLNYSRCIIVIHEVSVYVASTDHDSSIDRFFMSAYGTVALSMQLF
jgi:hypothetical protein